MRAEAPRLLTETDLKLETIAQRLDCASVEVFIALFQRLANESPTEWRARHR